MTIKRRGFTLVVKKRSEIWQEGYLKTLESGEEKKRRKIDKVRFDYFVVANSVNYIAKGKKPDAHIQMGGIQTNSIINKIIKSEGRILKKQPDYPSSDFHSKEYLLETFDINLGELGLRPDQNVCFRNGTLFVESRPLLNCRNRRLRSRCLLLGVKRTSISRPPMTGSSQKRTFKPNASFRYL